MSCVAGFLVSEGAGLRRGRCVCAVSLEPHLPGYLCMWKNECGLTSHSGHFYHYQRRPHILWAPVQGKEVVSAQPRAHPHDTVPSPLLGVYLGKKS